MLKVHHQVDLVGAVGFEGLLQLLHVLGVHSTDLPTGQVLVEGKIVARTRSLVAQNVSTMKKPCVFMMGSEHVVQRNQLSLGFQQILAVRRNVLGAAGHTVVTNSVNAGKRD